MKNNDTSQTRAPHPPPPQMKIGAIKNKITQLIIFDSKQNRFLLSASTVLFCGQTQLSACWRLKMCSFFDTIVLTKRTNIIWLYQPKLFCILWYLNTATFLSAKSSLAILLWPLTSTFRPALSEIVKLILNNSWKSLKSSSFSILMLRTHLNFSSLDLTLSTYLKMLTCCHVISCWDRRIKKQLNTWLSGQWMCNIQIDCRPETWKSQHFSMETHLLLEQGLKLIL